MDTRTLSAIEKTSEDEIILKGGTLEGTYIKTSNLGGGESGEVHEYTCLETKETIAVKHLYRFHDCKKEEYKQKSINEQKLTAEMLGFSAYCFFKEEIYICMPVIFNSHLVMDAIQEAEENDKKMLIIVNTLKAVDAMHKKNITHGDLSRNTVANPETGEVIIHDFGSLAIKHARPMNPENPEIKKMIDADIENIIGDITYELQDSSMSLVTGKYSNVLRLLDNAKTNLKATILELEKLIEHKPNKPGLFEKEEVRLNLIQSKEFKAPPPLPALNTKPLVRSPSMSFLQSGATLFTLKRTQSESDLHNLTKKISHNNTSNDSISIL
jgi:hypothetical protein